MKTNTWKIENCVFELQIAKDGNRLTRDCISADLVAWKATLIEKQNSQAAPCSIKCSYGPRWTAAYDDEIVIQRPGPFFVDPSEHK